MWDLPVVLLAGVAPERGKRNGRVDSPKIRLSRPSILAAEAGLLALFAVFVAFASFGPQFDYWVGVALFAFATGSGFAAVALAHRSAHAHRRDPHLAGRRYATIGSLTGWLAFLAGISYLGLVYILFQPLIWLVSVPFLAAAITVHADRWGKEDAFVRSLNLAADAAACGWCRRYIPLSMGRWRAAGWLCPMCDANRWGALA